MYWLKNEVWWSFVKLSLNLVVGCLFNWNEKGVEFLVKIIFLYECLLWINVKFWFLSNWNNFLVMMEGMISFLLFVDEWYIE